MTRLRYRLQYPLGPKYAIKVALAAGLATLIVQLFHMTYPFFAPLSAIIVMDTTARADPALSRARLLGAVGGGALGYCAAVVAPDDWWSVALVVLAVMLIGIAFRLGAATRQMAVVAAVIVMAPVGTDLFKYATARIIETAIGIAAALIVSRFVWPPRLAADARDAFATLYDHLLAQYDAIVAGHAGAAERDLVERLDQSIQADLHDINDRWDEAIAEQPPHAVLPPELRVVSRRVRTAISGMDTALHRRPSGDNRLAALAAPITRLTHATSRALAGTAAALHEPRAPFPDVAELEVCVTEVLAAAGALDDGFAGAGAGAVLAEFTYLFMLREVATRLVDLAEPHPVPSRADTAPATPNP